jgi:hypothetical protein
MEMSKVLVNFIQDRSGSMQNVWDETLNGFKSFLNELRDKGKRDGTEYLFSLTTFDTLVETPIVAQSIETVDSVILSKHGPRGWTALYDAVGATIQNVDADRRGAEKIIIVVVTDGHENSSREWNKDNLHTAIDARLRAGDWTFTYLGTQPETWDDAGALGLQAGAVSRYRGMSSEKAYGAVADAINKFSASPLRGTRNLMKDFLDDAKAADADMEKRGPASDEHPESKTQDSESKKGRWR